MVINANAIFGNITKEVFRLPLTWVFAVTYACNGTIGTAIVGGVCISPGALNKHAITIFIGIVTIDTIGTGSTGSVVAGFTSEYGERTVGVDTAVEVDTLGEAGLAWNIWNTFHWRL